jgi:NAD(P)-dependent dehydrogenase (short-subunit alcohol dehydrogenase family)
VEGEVRAVCRAPQGLIAAEDIPLSAAMRGLVLVTASSSGRAAGKCFLITGAPRGMGRSHALRLAEEGADLILVDICQSLPQLEYPLASEEELAETARLVTELGRRCVSHVVDVRDDVALRSAVDEGVSELGALNGAVANAAVLTAAQWDSTTPEQWRTVVDVNLIGVRNTCAGAIPHLLEQGRRQSRQYQLGGRGKGLSATNCPIPRQSMASWG